MTPLWGRSTLFPDRAPNFMDPSPSPSVPDPSMAVSTSKTVSLTTDQISTIFGDQPVESGKTYEVSLVAGEPGEGSQDFVVDAVGGADEPQTPEGDPEVPVVPSPDEEPLTAGSEGAGSADEQKALGYDRGALLKRRKKNAAPLMDLSE